MDPEQSKAVASTAACRTAIGQGSGQSGRQQPFHGAGKGLAGIRRTLASPPAPRGRHLPEAGQVVLVGGREDRAQDGGAEQRADLVPGL
jgi:hypothetical protein